MYVLPDSIQTNQALSIIEISVLRALAHHCGSKRECWPSVPRIALFCRRSPRTVQRTLPRLGELKLVEIRERRGKSNIYTVACLEERTAINRGDTMASPEQNTSLLKQRLGTAIAQGAKSWKEIRALLEDISEVMGETIAQRNRGWFLTIARRCSWESVQTALHALRCRMLEVAVTGEGTIRNPSAWLTWALRNAGQPI